MQKTKKLISIAVATAFAVGLLSGCGAKPEGSKQTEAQNVQKEAGTAEKEKTSEKTALPVLLPKFGPRIQLQPLILP